MGRMFLENALRYDVGVDLLDPDPDCSCARLASRFVQGSFDDRDTVLRFAKDADVVGIEIEHVSVEALAELKAQGIADAHLYIDSEGGSVLQAKRIVASVRAFGGRVTGEGAAMVASAATYIGAHLDEFKLQKYTAYMIHKPETEVRGNEDVVASDLKALGDITKEYRAAYAKRSGKTEDEIEAIWSKGEQWYTGEEAVAQGFVDGLVDDYTESADEETLARMAACGCPKDLSLIHI